MLRFLLGTRGKFITNRMVDSKGRGNFAAPSRKMLSEKRYECRKKIIYNANITFILFYSFNLRIATTTFRDTRYSKCIAAFKYRPILFPISNLVASSRSRCIGYRLRVTEGGTRLAGSVSRNKTKGRELFGCRTISHAVTMGRVEWLYNGNTRHEASLHVDNSTEIGIYHRWLIMESRGEWCPIRNCVSYHACPGYLSLNFFQILYGWFVIFLNRMSSFFLVFFFWIFLFF